MNIYLISQTKNKDYDTFDSAVVAAESADAARIMHPRGDGYPALGTTDESFYYYNWVTDPADVTVKYLGLAEPGTPAGVILGSFNAG